jgi:cytochrome c oxidase accessory protein FixG
VSDATAAPGESLYAKRVKIHAREVKGFFENVRNGAVIALLGLYYVGPWLRWDGRQAVLFDLPARKFHIFGLTLWPQDFFFLSWLLVMAALLLFFVTAVAGRVWCGYACPQTVWTQVFVWMERLTEGTFAQRIKLDKAPWSAEKALRKGAKQALWIGFAAWTGFTFVGYFTPILELGSRLVAFELGGWETFWVCFYGVATYGNAGHLREQVCKYMCPYARFQSAMFDRDTLIVSYDTARGEPRGGRKRGADPAKLALGACVDCNMCVQACPTGIDIRKGLQYECITCASCIDACDAVMDRFGYPRGLIRYTTQNALQGKGSHVLRPRVVIYGALLAVLFVGFVVALANRAPVTLDVLRDRNALYRELPADRIENVYQLKILNKDDTARVVRVSVAGLDAAVVETVPASPELAPGEVLDVVARVSVARAAAGSGGRDVIFRLEDAASGAVQAERVARFMAPVR